MSQWIQQLLLEGKSLQEQMSIYSRPAENDDIFGISFVWTAVEIEYLTSAKNNGIKICHCMLRPDTLFAVLQMLTSGQLGCQTRVSAQVSFLGFYSW